MPAESPPEVSTAIFFGPTLRCFVCALLANWTGELERGSEARCTTGVASSWSAAPSWFPFAPAPLGCGVPERGDCVSNPSWDDMVVWG